MNKQLVAFIQNKLLLLYDYKESNSEIDTVLQHFHRTKEKKIVCLKL